MLKCFAEKMWATHIFSAKNIRILCIESAKTVNEMTLNDALNNRAQTINKKILMPMIIKDLRRN